MNKLKELPFVDVKDYKEVALMCPECFEIVGLVEQKFEAKFFIDKNGKEKIYGHNIQYQIDGYCDNCDKYQDEFIEIDLDIASTISTLNKKGWKTVYCCAGHDNSPGAYIFFKNIKYLKYMLFVPKGWHIDLEVFSQRKEFIIRSEYGEYNPEELYKWVNSLPYLTDIDKVKVYYDEIEFNKLLSLNNKEKN